MTHQTVGHAPAVDQDGPLADCPDSALVSSRHEPRCPVSDKVLSDRLAQLTGAGVVQRHRRPGWPPRVRYVLTGQGRALEPVVRSMWEWGTARQDALSCSSDPSDPSDTP